MARCKLAIIYILELFGGFNPRENNMGTMIPNMVEHENTVETVMGCHGNVCEHPHVLCSLNFGL